MGFVVKLANLIINTDEKDKLNLIVTAEWSEFVAGELVSPRSL